MGLPILESSIVVARGRAPVVGAVIAGLVALGGVLTPLHAAESVLMNESAAHLCYLAAARGGTFADTEDCDIAIDHQSLKREDFAATLSNRGLLLARNNDLDEALRDHDRAIETAPEIPSLYVNRANTFTRGQRYDAARSDLDRAIGLIESSIPVAVGGQAPTSPPAADTSVVLGAALFNRALILQREGNLDAALADATRARDLVLDRPIYGQYVQDLERLRAERTPPTTAEEPAREEG
ncbi:MAG: tetratricopeptide repeat protein [Pseudomonadales bacterium]